MFQDLNQIQESVHALYKQVNCLLSVSPAAPKWTEAHQYLYGNNYIKNQLVWYDGYIYKCLKDNDGIPVANSFYWLKVTTGYMLPQEQADWFSQGGDNYIRNKPTKLSDFINDIFPGQDYQEQDPVFNAWLLTNPYVPPTRTLTINGVTYDLSEDRTWNVSGGGSSYTDENAQDAVGNILTASPTIAFFYDDNLNIISADIISASITQDRLAPDINVSHFINDVNYESLFNKGIPDGYAPLDSNGKIPLQFLNDAILGNVVYQGVWNQTTNSPNLDVVAPKGHYYVCNGPTQTTRYGFAFNSGDWIISNGNFWEKVDNTDAVSTVFGRTGNIVATNGDYNTGLVTEVVNKRYQTDTQRLYNDATSSIQTQLDSKASDANALHKSGNETFTGIKSAYNTNTPATDGIYLYNSGSTDSSPFVIDNVGGGKGTRVGNYGGGVGHYIYNSGGIGLSLLNLGYSTGMYINSDAGSFGDLIMFTKDNTRTSVINHLGRLVISGGTDKDFLKADGSLDSTLYEDSANKQNNLNYDGTGVKFPTVDATNNLSRSLAKVSTKTGLVSKLDTFNLTVLNNNTARIAPVESAIFWNELFVVNTAPSNAIKSFAQKDYPLDQLLTPTGGNINTNPLGADGIYVRFLGYDKNGNVVSSANTFATNNDVLQLGFVTVLKVGSAITFLDGVAGPRNLLAQPPLASNTDFDKIASVTTNVAVAMNAAASFNTTQGNITGISINWKTSNNPSNGNSIDIFPVPAKTGNAPFVSVNPNFLSQITAPVLHTLWTESEGGIQINQSFYNTTTGQREALSSTRCSVKRVLLGVRGGLFLQDGEHASNTAAYPDIATAKNNIYNQKFTDVITPVGLCVEIARIAFKSGVTDLSNDSQAYLVNTAGSGATGSAVPPPPVSDATTASKGIIKLTGDFDPSSTADLPIIRDASLTDRGLVNIGTQSFKGNKTFQGTGTIGGTLTFQIKDPNGLNLLSINDRGELIMYGDGNEAGFSFLNYALGGQGVLEIKGRNGAAGYQKKLRFKDNWSIETEYYTGFGLGFVNLNAGGTFANTPFYIGGITNGNSRAGDIGMGTITPLGKLDVVSTTRGSLPFPRMTSAQRTAIASPPQGLFAYQTDTTEGLYGYKSTGWVRLLDESSSVAPRYTAVAYSSLTSGNLTPNLDTTDILEVTGVTGVVNILNPTGTKITGKTLTIIITNSGASTFISTGTDYIPAEDIALPTRTVAGKGCRYTGRIDSAGKLVSEFLMPKQMQIEIDASFDVTTDTQDWQGNGQSNRHIILNNSGMDSVMTVNRFDDRPRTYMKMGTGNTTFVAGAGMTLFAAGGVTVMNGAEGSTASLTCFGTSAFLRISND